MATVKKLGRYEVKRKLGEGGMGEVFLAHDKELDREVAIKVLLPEFCCDLERVNRFKLEAKSVSALNHPNIITIYEIGGSKDTIYIVTEYIKGETLRNLIQRGAVSAESTLDFAQQIADALITAHKEGIVHRDIKPENIMVREDGILKVLDFGLAKPTEKRLAKNEDREARGEDESTLSLSHRPIAQPLNQTAPGMVLGSAGYMSPEQARGKEVDERSDIWSFGVVLYEMLTSRNPFDGETTTDILANIIHQEPAPISEFLAEPQPELHRIISKSLSKTCDQRYQTTKDLAIDLRNLRREVKFSGDEGFLSGQFSLDLTATSSYKLQNTDEAKTLIHHTVAADSLGNKKTELGKLQKKRNWLIPIGIASLACLIALGAWYYTPLRNPIVNFDSLQITNIAGSDKAFSPSISPDGKYLSYVNYENGTKSLVVKQIATGSVIPLVSQIENEGFLQPTFSPDGNYVYYVLADKGIGTLYQIPTLGGSPKKLITDVDSRITFSPDGSQIAFRRRDAETGSESIYLANADGTKETAFISNKDVEVTGFNEVAWSPKGKSLLVSGAGDYLPEDIVKTKLLVITLADKTITKFSNREWLNASSFCFTKDGLSLLMLAKTNDQEPAQIWQLSYPEGNVAKRLTNDSSGYQLISFANETNTITAAKQNTISSLWSFNPTTKELNQVTTDNKNLLGATGFDFLPDGKILTSKVESNKSNLVLLNANGKDEKLLTNDEGFNGQAVVSPDGKFIVYSSSNEKNLSIWRIDIDGKNPLQLTKPENGYDSRPQITADSKTIIFERRNLDFSKSGLMKMPIEGGEATVFIADDKQLQMLPQLSNDGKLLVYSTMSFDKANTRYDRFVRVINLNNSELKDLKKEFNTNLGYNYRVTPDGKNLTYINLKGVPNIYNIPLDGLEPKQITNFNSGHTINFAWSKDGKKLYIVRAIINSELVLLKNGK